MSGDVKYFNEIGVELAEAVFSSIYRVVLNHSDRIHITLPAEFYTNANTKPFIKNETLTLSIGPKACKDLQILHGRLRFTIGLGGYPTYFDVPIQHVLYIGDGYGTYAIRSFLELYVTRDIELTPAEKTKPKPVFSVITGGRG